MARAVADALTWAPVTFARLENRTLEDLRMQTLTVS
jgi:hypothetical protein